MGLPGMGLPEMGLPRLYLPGLGLPARGAQPGNYHDTLSYQPREDHVARLHFQLHEKKLLREAPNSSHFDLPGGGMRMLAPGPHPGTSALGRPPGGSMDWAEQERELQEVTRQLSNYVLEGSKEWKHERRKANNRLYQRLKRNGQHIVYEEHEIRVDMWVKHKDKAEAKKAWLLPTGCWARLPVWPAAGASSQTQSGPEETLQICLFDFLKSGDWQFVLKRT